MILGSHILALKDNNLQNFQKDVMLDFDNHVPWRIAYDRNIYQL